VLHFNRESTCRLSPAWRCESRCSIPRVARGWSVAGLRPLVRSVTPSARAMPFNNNDNIGVRRLSHLAGAVTVGPSACGLPAIDAVLYSYW